MEIWALREKMGAIREKVVMGVGDKLFLGDVKRSFIYRLLVLEGTGGRGLGMSPVEFR
jgi:hypothetical protein